MPNTKWKELVADKRRRLTESIPAEWLLKDPPDESVLNVTDIPKSCGLLSTKEIEITEKSVVELLSLLANGTLSSVDVTTAFYKRAIIAHQLVRS